MSNHKIVKPYSFLKHAPKKLFYYDTKIMLLTVITLLLFLQVGMELAGITSDSSRIYFLYGGMIVLAAIIWFISRRKIEDQRRYDIYFFLLIFSVMAMTYLRVVGAKAPITELYSIIHPMIVFVYAWFGMKRCLEDNTFALKMMLSRNKWYCWYLRKFPDDSTKFMIFMMLIAIVAFVSSFGGSYLFDLICDLQYGPVLTLFFGIFWLCFLMLLLFFCYMLSFTPEAKIGIGRTDKDGKPYMTEDDKELFQMLGISQIS